MIATNTKLTARGNLLCADHWWDAENCRICYAEYERQLRNLVLALFIVAGAHTRKSGRRRRRSRDTYEIKVSDDDVREIYTRGHAGENITHLAAEFEVSRAFVQLVMKKKKRVYALEGM